MQGNNTNVQAPNFAPTVPVYPPLAQLNRVTGPAVGSLGGKAVYPAYTQQFNPPLGLRDREASYVFEPNGIVLSPSIYDCRLVGNYAGNPLYAVCCCPIGSSSLSSAIG